ncbi:MAG: hypothetical protein AB1646_20780 [Thermodesulfobacteriota bacterium]
MRGIAPLVAPKKVFDRTMVTVLEIRAMVQLMLLGMPLEWDRASVVQHQS